MLNPNEATNQLRDALRQQFPGLQQVAKPRQTLFGPVPVDPDAWPDVATTRGHYLPVPPPAGHKVEFTPAIRMRGALYGRRVQLYFLFPNPVGAVAPPTMLVETWGRFVRPETPPGTAMPWTTWACDPGPVRGITLTARGRINMVGMAARFSIGRAGVLSGRPLVGQLVPPVQSRLFLGTSSPEIFALLSDPSHVALLANWERRAGRGLGDSGPTLPVFDAHANVVRFATGMDGSVPASEHARTVREALEVLVELEMAATGLDANLVPLPTLSFEGPPGTLPEVRPAYTCPRCGRLEILKLVSSRNPAVAFRRTFGCGVDYFRPLPMSSNDSTAAFRASEAAGTA